MLELLPCLALFNMEIGMNQGREASYQDNLRLPSVARGTLRVRAEANIDPAFGEHEPEEFWEEFLDLLSANAANFPISSYAEEMDIKNSHDFIMIRTAESSLRERRWMQ